MKLLEQVSEDHMVAAFLRAEIDLPDFRFLYRIELKKLGLTRSLVETPDLQDSDANVARKHLLATGGRGYPKHSLFQGWPTDVEWWKAEVAPDELGAFRFINDLPWMKLSAGTRLVKDGAANVGRNPELDSLSSKIKAVAERVREGHTFAELLLVAVSRNDPIVILEGNARAAAYVLAGRAAPHPIAVLSGYSPNLQSWAYFGRP
jgi:hypothetical protein